MECEGGVTHSHQNLRHIGEEEQENGWHYIVAQVGIKAHFQVTRHFGTADTPSLLMPALSIANA